METNQFLNDFKENSFYRLDESTRMIERSLLEISSEELWKKSIAALTVLEILYFICAVI